MAGEVNLDAFRQETFATALTASGQRCASPFGAHARAKTVLLFSRSLGWLISALHEKNPEMGSRKEPLP